MKSEHELKMSNLAEKLSEYIDKWDIVSLNSEIKKPEHEEWIKNNAWDLIPILVFPASDDNLLNCPQVVHSCSQILADYVAKLGNPKEILISLLEQCEHSGSSVTLRHCLPAIEIALLKLNLRVATLTWDWALRTIVEHLTNLKIPDIAELEGNERLVFEHDQECCDRLASCQEVASVLKSLSVRLDDFEDSLHKSKLKGYIVWSCIHLLGHPLSYFNVCKTEKGNSTTAKVISDQLTTLVNQICSDQVKLIDLPEFCDFYGTPKLMESDPEIWLFGVGNIFHCQFSNGDPNIPLCYSPVYLYFKLLKTMIQMILFIPGENSPYFRQEKSLSLCTSLLTRIPKSQVPEDSLELEDQLLFISKLYEVIIYHGLESVRKMGFNVYNRIFDLFGNSSKGLSMMVKHALEKANHSGLIGHTIGKLKNGVLSNMKYPSEDLSGIALQSLVRKFCCLKNGAETDLLEISDEIMASLNFLICLLLRDKTNILQLWDIIPELNEHFLKPLSTGLSMSRAHYKLKLDEPANSNNGAVTMMVGGQTLPDMSSEQMKEVILSALNTFDMIECVLCQLNDTIYAKKNNVQSE